MFIKVTNHSDDKTIILNTDFIRSIEHKVYDDGERGSTICTSNYTIFVKECFGTFEMLLDILSVEKKIEELKQENFRLRQNKIYEECAGRVVNTKGE